jgi:D-alanyl-D-alanine carboxypeptidase
MHRPSPPIRPLWVCPVLGLLVGVIDFQSRNSQRRLSRLALLVCLLVCLPASTWADRVDDYVKAQMQRRHVPGVSLAVIRDGKVVRACGYGTANVELGVPATKKSVYGVLSITKQFTAAAILILVEEGKISLVDRISQYIPDTPPAWSEITVRHLLTHTSGIRDYTDVPGWFDTIRLDRSPEELIKSTKAFPLQFHPGDSFRYCNAGYYLLGMILEKVSGRSYADFLQERIFKPLGMTATQVDDGRAIVPHRASGYHWEDGVLQNAPYVSPTQKWAAGAVLSSVEDLARWDAALYTDRLLKRQTLAQMWTPARLNNGQEAPYGFGNELDMDRGHRAAGHQGGAVAFNVTLLRYPDDRLTVVVLCNQTSAPSRAMARKIASFYLPALSYERDKGIEDKDPQTTERLKGVLIAAAEGKVDSSLFSPQAQAEIVPFIQRVGPNYLRPLGAMTAFVLLETREEKESRVYRYRAIYKDSSLLWTFALTKEGKISSLQPTEE